jgi:hypothetical protein
MPSNDLKSIQNTQIPAIRHTYYSTGWTMTDIYLVNLRLLRVNPSRLSLVS